MNSKATGIPGDHQRTNIQIAEVSPTHRNDQHSSKGRDSPGMDIRDPEASEDHDSLLFWLMMEQREQG